MIGKVEIDEEKKKRYFFYALFSQKNPYRFYQNISIQIVESTECERKKGKFNI